MFSTPEYLRGSAWRAAETSEKETKNRNAKYIAMFVLRKKCRTQKNDDDDANISSESGNGSIIESNRDEMLSFIEVDNSQYECKIINIVDQDYK